MLQLNLPLSMQILKGEGLAHILIDYGSESDHYWTAFVTEASEVVDIRQPRRTRQQEHHAGTCQGSVQSQQDERGGDTNGSGTIIRHVKTLGPAIQQRKGVQHG